MSSITEKLRKLSLPELAALRALASERSEKKVTSQPIVRLEAERDFPLSFAQQRLWFLAQMEGLSAAYNIPAAMELRGRLDPLALQRALDALVVRHESLRTCFMTIDGDPIQRIASPDTPFPLAFDDLREVHDQADAVAALLDGEASAPFNLSRAPLVRGRLIRCGDERWVLSIVVHHIVSDGWSNTILIRELSALYAGFARGTPASLPTLPIRYVDYAVWQRRWLSNEALSEQAAYWREQLAGAPALLELPTDRQRPAVQAFAGDTVALEIDAQTTAELKSLSRRCGTTLYMTVLAAWAIVLARLSGQQDLVIGTPEANRSRLELEGLIGFFVNTLALRIDLSGNPTVETLLAHIRNIVLDAQKHHDLPFEQIVEIVNPERSLAYAPIFQVMFLLQSEESSSLALEDITIAPMRDTQAFAKFDAALDLSESEGRLIGGINYATALFKRDSVERWASYLHCVLTDMAAARDTNVELLPMLPPDERRRMVVDWNDTAAPYSEHLCLHEPFERSAARTPDAPALRFEEQVLSYAELNRQANQLARHLRGLGVAPGVRVAICVERAVEMVVGLLAILKAGGTYIPLDPAYPAERLAFMLADAHPQVALTHAAARAVLDAAVASLSTAPPAIVDLVADAPGWAEQPGLDLPVAQIGLDSHQLAYVIYTSGSTGKPKGIMVAHAPAINLIEWVNETYAVDAHDCLLFVTSISFDLSVYDIFGILAAGGTIWLASQAMLADPERLTDALLDERVTFWDSAPAALQLLTPFLEQREHRNPALRLVFNSGDWIPLSLPAAIAARCPNAQFVALGGATEATIWSNAYDVHALDPAWRSIPYGRPIRNARYYILDRHLQPVPVGVIGNLYIAGPCLAQGYTDAQLTAERFIAGPAQDIPGPLYCTGDLARFYADGNIEFIGRNDFQVKIRGFRIELGEIEAQLSACAGVREAVVLAREDVPGNKRLVAYYTCEPGAQVTVDGLLARLTARLPEYMVPTAYLPLEAMPVTANGKLDRKALPAPDGGAYLSRPYEAPVGEVEDVIARIWSEILGVERVGRHDNFFELGGHSLLAVRMLSTIQRELSVAVPLANVFTCPTLAGFAGGMAVHKTSALEPIVRLEAERDFPLSFAQQRLWFLAQMEGLSAAYNIPAAMELRGRLDPLALQCALDALVVRHESLRTCFMTIDGDPIQRIAPPDTPFPLAFDDLREVHDQADAVAALLDGEASAPFNLSRAPLVRGRLIRCGDERWVLSIVVHHIVSDGWSNTILIRELSALYAGFARGTPASLPTLPIRYVDYAVWQRRWLSNEALSEQAAYWREQLAGAPALLELPTDRQRPAVQAFAGDTVALEIDAQTTAELKSLSRRCGTTLYMTVLAAWAIVLARLSGQQDLVIGTPVANRPRHDLEGMVGFFVNTLALRIDLSGDPSIAMLLERIRATTIAAQEQQSLPFEQIVEIVNPPRSLSYSPIFQVMFSWQNMERAEFSLDEAIIKPLEQSEPFARFDLALDMRESEDVLKGTLNYATALFDTSTAQRFANYLRQILVEVASDSSRGIEALRMLPTEERHRLVVEWNDTVVPYPAERCIHQIFEDRVAEAPDAVALHFEAQSRSYGELNREANRLARHLRSLGVRPGLRVAICVERSFEMYIGLLAIVKAGGAYVPMEPSYPVERLAFMLEDADPMVVLTHQVARPLIEAAHAMAANAKMPIIDLLGDAMDWASADDSDLPIAEVGLDGRCVAYMIYTSGSTGRPKGAMIEHHSLINRLLWMRNAYGLGQEDIAIQKTPFTFDVSVWEIFGTLIHGAPLVVARPEGHRDPDYLVDLIQAHGAATIHFVPSMLQLFLENKRARTCISLRNVFCSGEELPSTLARRFVAAFEEAALHNLYGPTEATIDVTAWSCPRPFVEGQAVPIGRPIDNTFAYILDGHNEPAAIGVVGELCIGGVGVARGYFNRPELTAERFVANPFLAGDRLYRTGDLARFRADGNIEFVGRNDFQVKLRGLRIELGEIEAQLGTCPGVREAVVLVREDVPGDRRLVAYYAADSDVVASSLAAELAPRLPDYMVPSAYVRVDAMPVTSNGKLDRKSLPAPDAAPLTDRAYESPVGPTETAIAAIWSEVLGVREVGRHDHFFELGGHSLLAIRVIEQLRGKGVRANVLNLFRTPVLSQLATTLTSGAEDMSFVPGPIAEGTERITPDILPLVKLTQDEIDRIVQGVPGGARNLQDVYPLTHLQEGLLFHHMMERESDPYLMWNLMRFRDRAALDAYAVALSTVISRHDALRTGIVWEGLSEPVQVVWREAPLHVETIDVGDGHGEFEERMVACIDPRRKRLDLGQAPLIRLYAARDVATGEWLAMRLVHHVIDDVTTAQLLDHEILAHIQGREAELPFPLPFKLAVMRARRAGDAESQERFFRSMLADVEEPTTPFGLRDVHGDGTSVSEARIRLPSALSSCIRQQARRLGVNAASMLHVAWGQVIARASGRTDAVFGTVLFGRLASGESADRIFGPFINTLPLLVPADDTGAAEGVRETHRRLTELIGHEQASLALAQRCALLPPQAPLFTAILNYRHGIDATPDDRDHALLDQIQEIRSEERTNYPLVLNVDDLGDDFLLAVQSTAGVDPALVCAMLQTALTSLTEALAVSPTRPLGGLDVLPPDERRRMVVDWNDTAAPYSEHLCLHEPFERSAARTPDAPALRFEEQVLSYAELNRQANQLARHLRGLGVAPGVRVAICVERAVEMVVGLLAILKAGGTYIPLDPAYPAERLAFMLADAHPQVALTHAAARAVLDAAVASLSTAPPAIVDLVADAPGWAEQPGLDLPVAQIGLDSHQLAYVIYTSGSTGKPKGIMVAHAPAINLIEWVNETYAVDAHDCLLFVTSISFDLSVYDIFGILAAGGTIWLASQAMLADPERLTDALLDERVTFWDSAPAALQLLTPFLEQREHRNPALRLVFNSGDWIPLSLPAAIAARCPNAQFVALGGATEATIWSNAYDVHALDPAWRSIPYGRPIRNARYYILDRHLQPVPVGVIGNLYIAGPCLAQGYTDAQLTAERFIAGPAQDIPGPLYCTGDLARFYADGNIEFIGRNDFQVKIRGFRIELGEIEAQLSACAGVREAVVLAREDVPGNKRLVAYYTCEPGAQVTVDGLLARLTARLPEYMVPTAYLPLEAMPVTANGKLDRKALPAPDGGAYLSRPYEAPVGEVEDVIARIWSEILGVERVGRHDNFFELGGHSLLAVRVMEQMRRANLQADIRTLFTTPVLSEIAANTQEYGEIFL